MHWHRRQQESETRLSLRGASTRPSHRVAGVVFRSVVFLLFVTISSLLHAAPTNSGQARRAVRGWLRSHDRPLNVPLQARIDRVETYRDEAGQPLYYVVYLDPSGFAIVPAEDQVEPIVAFAAEGEYVLSEDNPLAALVSRDLPGRVLEARGAVTIEDENLVPAAAVAHREKRQERVDRARSKWARFATSGADGPAVQSHSLGGGQQGGVSQQAEATTGGDTSEQSGGDQEDGSGALDDVRVPPLVLSRWNQMDECGSACYNYYTPNIEPNGVLFPPDNPENYPCGCVATALAQVLRYFEFPLNGIGLHDFEVTIQPNLYSSPSGSTYVATTRGGDGFGGPYQWDLMQFDPSCATTAEQREAIGAICYDAGISVNMNYSATASGADTLQCKDALTTLFGYSNAVKGFNNGMNIGGPLNDMVNPNLDAGYPVLLGIAGYGGHAIVSDGYGYNGNTLYHHLNMGWGGANDAWYNLPNIGTAYAFSSVYKCVYNIFMSGSGEIISGRIARNSGDPIVGAVVTAQRGGGETYTTTTSSNGIYAFDRVPSNSSYTITVTYDGVDFAPMAVNTGDSTDLSTSTGNYWGADFIAVSPTGEVNFDQEVYYIGQTINITLSDSSLLGNRYHNVTLYGQTGDIETVRLKETPYRSAVFVGSIPTTYSAIVHENGYLQVAPGETINVAYGNIEYGDPIPPATNDSAIVMRHPVSFYSQNMDECPNWQFEGDWAWGVSPGLGGNDSGSPDPNVGYTGTNIVGFNLLGDYDNDLPKTYVTTEPIDCSGYSLVELSFYRWLGVGHSDYDHASIDVTNDGVNWVTVWENTDEIKDTVWTKQTINISHVADHYDTVQLRWCMGETNASWRYCGWNIDDVELVGAPGHDSWRPDANGDGAVDLGDFHPLYRNWQMDDPNCPDPNCGYADFNRDARVNLADLYLLSEYWLAGRVPEESGD